MAQAKVESRKPYDDVESIRLALIEDIRSLENGPLIRAGTSQSILDVIVEDIPVLETQIKNWEKDIPNGITTGFPKIDKETCGGFHGSEMHVIAARTGQGKTQLAIWFTIQAAFKGYKAAYFTVEMPNRQLARKMYSNISGVDSKKVASGRLDPSETDSVSAAMKMLSGKTISLDDKFKRSYSAFESEVRRLRRQGLCDICVIDYLQQLRIKEQKFFSLNEQLTEISGRIKALAIELNIPIIVIAQLNRDAETAPEGPCSYHIKDCGCIEQDADMITILYDRPLRENKENPHEITGFQKTIVVDKNRWGEEFSMKIEADLSTSRFKEM
jgi:replicative DNA helicase